MKLLIIINIAAGFGDGSVYDYLRMVCEDGDEHALRCTDGTTNVTKLVQDAEDFDAVVDVNVKGVFYMTKLVSMIMTNQRYGRIINITTETDLLLWITTDILTMRHIRMFMIIREYHMKHIFL